MPWTYAHARPALTVDCIKRSFRKRILGRGVLVEQDEIETDDAHRAARLRRFDRARHTRLSREGFHFEI